ncbi:hypothetical protein BMS3Bbin10_01412 [bacterium BMS3Bbin10]|nr:hypothetical protein BMS3Bbin10_01412 [bacterium BMS3Bbin10]
MMKKCRGESCPVFDRAARPVSAALALVAVGATLVSVAGDLAAQGAGKNTLQAQIQRYGCNLPQYANSVPGCRELHARMRALKSGRAAPRRARQPYSGASRPVPGPPRQATGGGFFASLFGGGNTARRGNAGTRRYSAYSSPRTGGSDYGRGYSPRMPGYGRYRTLCVRSCDGYYWPVSFSTTRAGFSRDAKQCVSSCTVPAKLFVHRNPGADIAQMVDLKGKPYARTEHAFRYRQEYVKGCRCKPEPWSEAAKQDYANRVAEAGNPAPAEAPSAQQTEAPGAVSAPVYRPAPRPQIQNRRKARWRVRSDEADFSGQWWAGSW